MASDPAAMCPGVIIVHNGLTRVPGPGHQEGVTRRTPPGRSRQRDAKRAARWSAALEHERSVVCLSDPSRNGQAKACSGPTARRIELDEPVEHARLVSGRNAWPVVDHSNA